VKVFFCYLERGERGIVEGGFGFVLGVQSAADFGIGDAALDLGPVGGVVDALLEPVGVVAELVLLVAFARDRIPRAGVGDHEREDGEAEEEHDEEEHDEQVDQEQEALVAPRADHAGQRHQQDEHAQRDDRVLQKPHAHRVVRVRQPHSHADDRNRQYKRCQVQKTREQITAPHGHSLALSPHSAKRTMRQLQHLQFHSQIPPLSVTKKLPKKKTKKKVKKVQNSKLCKLTFKQKLLTSTITALYKTHNASAPTPPISQPNPPSLRHQKAAKKKTKKKKKKVQNSKLCELTFK
jgi:hypothetical protein